MGARNRVGIALSYRAARLHRLAESIPGLLKSIKIPAQKQRSPELEFLKSLWGLGTKEEEGYRTGLPGWRNSFLGIDSGAPYTFKNTGSVLLSRSSHSMAKLAAATPWDSTYGHWWKQLHMRSGFWSRLNICSRPLWKGGSAAISEYPCVQE